MTLLCNVLKDRAGIDWSDKDPEADFTIEQAACGKPARHAERNHADSGIPGTLFCEDCFHALGREGQVDIWPLRLGAPEPSSGDKT